MATSLCCVVGSSAITPSDPHPSVSNALSFALTAWALSMFPITMQSVQDTMAGYTIENLQHVIVYAVGTCIRIYLSIHAWSCRGVGIWEQVRKVTVVFVKVRIAATMIAWQLGATAYPPGNVSFFGANLITLNYLLCTVLLRPQHREYIGARAGVTRIRLALGDLSSTEQESALTLLQDGGMVLEQLLEDVPKEQLQWKTATQRTVGQLTGTSSEITAKGGDIYVGPLD